MIEKEILKTKEKKIEGWIIVTESMSGLGFAVAIKDGRTARGLPRVGGGQQVLLAVAPHEGEKDMRGLKRAGAGLVPKVLFDEIFSKRAKYKTWAWVFDRNHNCERADQLRKEGFMVFGGHALASRMEHDREFGISLIKRAGLSSPPSQECSSVKEGLDFMDKNPDIVYVFKPDEPDDQSWVTTATDTDNDQQARREMYDFLKAQPEGKGKFILQERKKGVEVNAEMWVYEGKPFFAFANFESKKKYNGDLGKMIGCAHDTSFIIPLESKILQDTLHRLVKLPEFKSYTGFLDMNMIVCDNEYWFLEFCARFGYNSHPTLFLGCALDNFADVMSDFILGKTENFYRHFRRGFGTSVTMWADDPARGFPIIFEDERENESRFYHYDAYKDADGFHTSGYVSENNEVGIAVSHDYDLESACENVLCRAKQIHYPGRAHRTDIAHRGYLSNVRDRYEACEAMELFK